MLSPVPHRRLKERRTPGAEVAEFDLVRIPPVGDVGQGRQHPKPEAQGLAAFEDMLRNADSETDASTSVRRVIAAAAEEVNNAVLLAPAIISVCGVLIIGAATLLLNRKIHLERLSREESTIRREAFTRYLATQQEEADVQLTYDIAYETWQEFEAVRPQLKPIDSKVEEDVKQTSERLDNRMRAAMKARTEWSTRALADHMAALATVTDEGSPLLLTAKLPQAFTIHDNGYKEAMELFLESLRVDAILNQRKRKKREADLVSRLMQTYSREVLFGSKGQGPATSPSGEDYQEIDQSTSETERGTDGSIDNGEPRSC